MLNDSQIAKINERIEEELARQLKQIPYLVERTVENSILAILGVERNGRGFKVDTFAGKENPVNSFVIKKVEGALKDTAEPIVNRAIALLCEDEKFQRDLAEKVSRNYRSDLVGAVSHKTKKHAESLAEKCFDKIQKEFDDAISDIGAINTDITDPNSFKGPLGEVLLEEAAEIMNKDM